MLALQRRVVEDVQGPGCHEFRRLLLAEVEHQLGDEQLLVFTAVDVPCGKGVVTTPVDLLTGDPADGPGCEVVGYRQSWADRVGDLEELKGPFL